MLKGRYFLTISALVALSAVFFSINFNLSAQEQTDTFFTESKDNNFLTGQGKRPSEIGTFTLQEDIFIKNTPAAIDAPFYAAPTTDFRITALQPQAEHFYFYNLKLKDTQNELVKQSALWWTSPRCFLSDSAGKPQQNEKHREEVKNGWSYKHSNGEILKKWKVELPYDYLNDYSFSVRQWVKHYEEPIVFTYVRENTVIARNEYRLFCVDLSSGKRLWSFGISNGQGHEYYQTFRHPHQNSYGNELLLDKDTVFTELNEKLVAVDIHDITKPRLLWKQDLGEYTLCAKPIVFQETLLAGLVNARGEIWLCGFNKENGTISWSTYVGISSFLSPVCTISAQDNKRVFVGTNRGVLISIDPLSGEILWLRKHIPRKYNLFDYWYKSYYKDKFLKKGSIAYDTQFMTLDSSRALYYKPRESQSLYVLDPATGRLKKEILIDTELFYLVGIFHQKAIFLERKPAESGSMKVTVVELSTGKVLMSAVLKGKKLRGIVCQNENQFSLKLDRTIHIFKIEEAFLEHFETESFNDGWLAGADGDTLFVSADSSLYCLQRPRQAGAATPLVSRDADYLQQKEAIKDYLVQTFRTQFPDVEWPEIFDTLITQIDSGDITSGAGFPAPENAKGNLPSLSYRELASALQRLYGDKIIHYHGVDMTFGNFLKGLKCLNGIGEAKEEADNKKIPPREKKCRDISIKGEELNLLPVAIIQGPKALDFFLLLRFDQLLCVNALGEILWDRKLFFASADRQQPIPARYHGRHLWRRNVEAYLYKNVLIVNDRVNIVAMDVRSGKHIWSMTNKGNFFEKGMFTQPFNLKTSHEESKQFVKKIMLYTVFLEDKLIAVHGNKIYLINPLTGFCEKYHQVSSSGALKVQVSDEYIYLLSADLTGIKVLNKKLEEINVISLNFVKRNEEIWSYLFTLFKRRQPDKFWPDFFIAGNHIIYHAYPYIYILDRHDGKPRHTIFTGLAKNVSIEILDKEHFIVITPFAKAIQYCLKKDGSLKAGWKFAPAFLDSLAAWKDPFLVIKDHLMVDRYLLLFLRKKGEYFLAAVDSDTGKNLWKTRLTGAQGLFYHLSNPAKHGRELIFALSAVNTEGAGDERQIFSNLRSGVGMDIDSKIFQIHLPSGVIRSVEVLPSVAASGFIDTAISQTEECFIYDIYGKLLKVVCK